MDRSVVMTTPVLAFFERFGLINTIRAVGQVESINTAGVLAGVQNGSIATAGDTSEDVNLEVIASVAPDVVLVPPSNDEQTINRIRQAGHPVVFDGSISENTPVSRAEWTSKVVGLLFNVERQAEEAFTTIADEYQELTALAADVEQRPRVAAFYASSGGGLLVPQGGHWQVALYKDAGADYIFDANNDPGSETLDFEVVLNRAANADFLLNQVGNEWDTIAEMLADNPRFDAFAAVREGNVINPQTAGVEGTTPENDFFETGTASPDELLRDLVSIFHPDLLPDPRAALLPSVGQPVSPDRTHSALHRKATVPPAAPPAPADRPSVPAARRLERIRRRLVAVGGLAVAGLLFLVTLG